VYTLNSYKISYDVSLLLQNIKICALLKKLYYKKLLDLQKIKLNFNQ